MKSPMEITTRSEQVAGCHAGCGKRNSSIRAEMFHENRSDVFIIH